MSRNYDEPRISGAKLFFAWIRAILMIASMLCLLVFSSGLWEKLPAQTPRVMLGVAGAYILSEIIAAIWQLIANRSPRARRAAHEENGPARFWLWFFNILSVIGIGLLIFSVFKGETYWLAVGPERIGKLIYFLVRNLVRWSIMAWPITIVLHIIHRNLYRTVKGDEYEDDYEDDEEEYDDYDDRYDQDEDVEEEPEEEAPSYEEPAAPPAPEVIPAPTEPLPPIREEAPTVPTEEEELTVFEPYAESLEKYNKRERRPRGRGRSERTMLLRRKGKKHELDELDEMMAMDEMLDED